MRTMGNNAGGVLLVILFLHGKRALQRKGMKNSYIVMGALLLYSSYR